MTLIEGGVATEVDRARAVEAAGRPLSAVPRPFLKWAGSKRYLLPDLVDVLPSSYGRFWEPFLGGGSLFFLLAPSHAVISDSAAPLIDTYLAIREDVEALIAELLPLEQNEETFYRLRAESPSSSVRRAARFIYLNHTCWNGLYRVNSRGQFNVPYGRPRPNGLIDYANLRACADVLARPGVAICAGDFGDALDDVESGDLVFLDPPYVTRHNDNGFVDYNERLFAWKDQERLALMATDLARRGATVIVTNADHRDILDLYPNFTPIRVSRSSTLANNVSRRGRVTELLLVKRRGTRGG